MTYSVHHKDKDMQIVIQIAKFLEMCCFYSCQFHVVLKMQEMHIFIIIF